MKRTGCLFWLGLQITGTWASAQELNLGEEAPQSIIKAGSQYPQTSWALGLFLLYVAIGACLLAFLIFRKKRPWNPPRGLAYWPDSAKTLITLILIAYGLVHLFAILKAYMQSRVVFGSAAEYFFYMKPEKLAATSHAHIFGHGTMYALTCVLFLFSSISERWKVAVICVALAGGLLDVPSWWMIKYAGAKFEAFSIVAGMMSAAGWISMAGRILYEVWFQKEADRESR
ncbi:MAG: hypothetical protein QME66_08785 [Candidatus Eisenbacteria bacterium]|nr:hypothetical protein [Candidatus Eisenbacteria bacterium]